MVGFKTVLGIILGTIEERKEVTSFLELFKKKKSLLSTFYLQDTMPGVMPIANWHTLHLVSLRKFKF